MLLVDGALLNVIEQFQFTKLLESSGLRIFKELLYKKNHIIPVHETLINNLVVTQHPVLVIKTIVSSPERAEVTLAVIRD